MVACLSVLLPLMFPSALLHHCWAGGSRAAHACASITSHSHLRPVCPVVARGRASQCVPHTHTHTSTHTATATALLLPLHLLLLLLLMCVCEQVPVLALAGASQIAKFPMLPAARHLQKCVRRCTFVLRVLKAPW